MVLKNLLRRKTRTLLTVLGIAIGVAAILTLGALADGLERGYSSVLTGSKADLVLSQPNSFDIAYSSLEEALGEQISQAPEVAEISSMIQGFAQAENEPIFFVFGYPEDSFILDKYPIISGLDLSHAKASQVRGRPLLLGSAASEVLNKEVGDSIRLTGSVFRVAGIYQTGDAFEDSGAILHLQDAQILLGKSRQVSLFYIRLKDPALKDRFIKRVERQYSNISVSGISQFAETQVMADALRGYVWAIGGLAILIGGVGMMNAQMMSVNERTREIGVLRALGWRRRRVLRMIFVESISVSLLGGLLGMGLGYLLLSTLSRVTVLAGVSTANISPALLAQAFVIVILLGTVGGLYPAWRAANLLPVEALQYEGGSGRKIRRLPFGGLALQNLWQRSGRTALTLSAIGLTVGSIIALEGMVRGTVSTFDTMFMAGNAEVMLRQADVADTSLSAIDERTAARIAAMSDVKSTSGIVISAVMMPESNLFLIILGYAPNEPAIQRFKIVDGKPLASNHQVMVGRAIADSLKKGVGDTIELSGIRYRICGIYESNASWEEMGGVLTLRDAQILTGRPRKVTLLAVKLKEPKQAEAFVEKINNTFPEIHAAVSGEFVDQMPDMQSMDSMIAGISILAVLIGGVGVLNTMLMSVFERTREIGVLRALGWRSRQVLFLIIREALILGLIGGVAGILIAFALGYALQQIPMYGYALRPVWEWDIFVRAFAVSFILGLVGGIYPAYRATRLTPIEALRYE